MKNTKRLFFISSPIAVAAVLLISFCTGKSTAADSQQLHAVQDNQPLQYTGPATPTVNTALVRSGNQTGPDAGEMKALAVTDTTTLPATISVNGKRYGLRPNPTGIYPRLTIPAGSSVAIHLVTTPQNNVTAMVLDGGHIGTSGRVSSQTADTNGNVDFVYAATSSPGNHRITLVQGGQKQTFNFWIGPAPQMKVASQNN
jgi:hypothetical protein